MAYLSTGLKLDANVDLLGDSNGAAIVELSNQITGENEGVQATSGNRATMLFGETPANKKAAVFGVGGAKKYSFGNIFSGFTQGTIYVLAKWSNDPPGSGIGGIWSDVSDFQSHVSYSDGNIYDSWGSAKRTNIGKPSPNLATAHRLYTIVSKLNEWTVYLDGTQIYTTATNTPSFPSDFIFGESSLGAYFEGKLLRILAYNVAHNSSEVSANKTEFANEYQLTNLGYSPDSNPPTVLIISPSTGGSAISGNQDFVVSCSDNVHVTSLTLKVGGVTIETVTGENLTGHTFSLNTKAFTDGNHDIKVTANDGVNSTDSATITKTFSNSVSITGASKVAPSATENYSTDIPNAIFSIDSGLGSIDEETGDYTAPSSVGVVTLRAESEFGGYATKDVLYGVPFIHNNGNSRTYDISEFPAGYNYKARVKSVDEQGNTLGFTDWVEAVTE